jgi:hypothetical protein
MRISLAQLRSHSTRLRTRHHLSTFVLIIALGTAASLICTALNTAGQPAISTETEPDYRASLRLMFDSSNTILGALEQIPPRPPVTCQSPCQPATTPEQATPNPISSQAE